MSYLVDTDYLIDALKGRTKAVTTLERLSMKGLVVSLVTVGEIYEGAYQTTDPAYHLNTLRVFLQGFAVLGLDDNIMERFGQIRACLRQKGALIPDFDILIGATALQYDLVLLTGNTHHFQRIPDITIFGV